MPAKLRRLLQLCLQKDPKQRLQAIGDWRLAIEEAPLQSTLRGPWLWIAAAGLFLLTTLGLGFLHFREKPPAAPTPMRFQIPAPEKTAKSRFRFLRMGGSWRSWTLRCASGFIIWTRGRRAS